MCSVPEHSNYTNFTGEIIFLVPFAPKVNSPLWSEKAVSIYFKCKCITHEWATQLLFRFFHMCAQKCVMTSLSFSLLDAWRSQFSNKIKVTSAFEGGRCHWAWLASDHPSEIYCKELMVGKFWTTSFQYTKKKCSRLNTQGIVVV